MVVHRDRHGVAARGRASCAVRSQLLLELVLDSIDADFPDKAIALQNFLKVSL